VSKTRYDWVSTLHGFYQCQLRAGQVTVDPTSEIIRPKLPRYLPRPISDADLTMALESAGTMMGAWLTLGAYAGLRCAEISKLQRHDVIDGEGLLLVHGKGNRDRLVPIHPQVTAALRLAGMPKAGHLFRRPRGGPFPPAMVSREGALFFDGLGIDATMHQLRHWFGSKTYQACRDIRVVQELMGHSDPKTTAVYTAFSQEGATAAVMAIGLAA
jgi:integrase/recombinase XerC